MADSEEISQTGSEANQTKRLVAAIQPITEKVQSIVGKVKWMAWIYLVSAVVLSGMLFIPFSGTNAWVYAFAASVLLLLTVPSIILFLFHLGLQSIIALPTRLLEKAGAGEASARSMLQTVTSSNRVETTGKKGKLLSTLVELRGLVMESKDLLFEYTALLRLANPFVMGVVGIATVAGFGLTLATLITLLISVI